MGPKKEAKGGIDELWASHARIQQTIARMSESSDELTAAHEANTAHKKRIAEQDARALRMDVEHKKYREGMGRSFSSLQDGIQAFVVQMLDNAAEQLVEAKAASDTHKRFLTERDAGHKDCVRELTESFDAKLAEQIKRSELAEVHTRAELTKSFDAKLAEQIKRAELVEENTRAELTESFGAQLAKQLKRSELAQENTRAQLHLASQELLCFKQDMCLPLAGSECPDMWDERDDAAGCTVETVESINAFLEPYEDAVDDEITRVLAAAACGHKRAIGNACDGGLCAFELQAMVYPNAGAESFTSKAGKALAGQQAGAQARTQQVPWSPPPRAAKFKIGDRVSSKYKNCYYKWPGEIFDKYTAQDGSVEYSVSFDDGDVATKIKERFMTKESPAGAKRAVGITAPLVLRDLLRTYPSRV